MKGLDDSRLAIRRRRTPAASRPSLGLPRVGDAVDESNAIRGPLFHLRAAGYEPANALIDDSREPHVAKIWNSLRPQAARASIFFHATW
jgi:hypothetical protein